jgi:hypothetical protein
MMDARDDVADDAASHFTMSFDTSPVVLKRLGETLRADPLVVRCVHARRSLNHSEAFGDS